MHIKALFVAFLLTPALSFAGEHGPDQFHAVRLETDIGYQHGEALTHWNWEGWMGDDAHKLWLKSEGELTPHTTEKGEFWALYSRNVAEFWDAQIGLRQDIQPSTSSYFVVGVNGLAPYFFETEAHLFLSDKGHLSARITERNDLLLTQRLITQPYLELNLSASNVPEEERGRFFSSATFGVQTRYEFTREWAPYVDMRYETKLGNTARMAERAGENRDGFTAALGLRLSF